MWAFGGLLKLQQACGYALIRPGLEVGHIQRAGAYLELFGRLAVRLIDRLPEGFERSLWVGAMKDLVERSRKVA